MRPYTDEMDRARLRDMERDKQCYEPVTDREDDEYAKRRDIPVYSPLDGVNFECPHCQADLGEDIDRIVEECIAEYRKRLQENGG